VPNPSSRRQDKALVALGEAIRRERTSRGISQEALALRSDVDRSYLGRIERGDNNVAVLTLGRVAKALGLSLAQLMKKARL
jgi:transcriptional regulator with XRE-family HTH domain